MRYKSEIEHRYDTMVNFIGEQPVPNYLPVKWGIKHLGIKRVLNLYTDRTKRINELLEKIYKDKLGIDSNSVKVEPYDIAELVRKINKILGNIHYLIFNLTGGTKTMSFAGYSVSINYKIPLLYFQSEDGKMKIRMYEFEENSTIKRLKPVEIEDNTYDLEEYLNIHFDNFSVKNKWRHGGYLKDDIGQQIECEIVQTLTDNRIEALLSVNIPPDIQIDMFAKYGHNVGIVEIKKTLKPTPINQIASPSRQMRLGTYTYIRRIVVGGTPKDIHVCKNILDRTGIANVYIIELASLRKETLCGNDKEKLCNEIRC